MITLRDQIKKTVRFHLTQKKGLAMGQCLTAVGWVGGTLPELYEKDGMVELSMADVAGSGFVVGAALAGRRPIYIIRYQGFNWFNAPIIVNYAAKSKSIWGKPCPIFIRSIAMEGSIGPVAGSSHHSLYYRMPGIKIYSPMTPKEYRITYQDFMKGDDVMYVSEHRGAYNNTKETLDYYEEKPEITILPISITRFAAENAAKNLRKAGVKIGIIHLFKIKPLYISKINAELIKKSKKGCLIIDDDMASGMASGIAQLISEKYNVKTWVLGIKEETAGFAKHLDNLPPNESEIEKKIMSICQYV